MTESRFVVCSVLASCVGHHLLYNEIQDTPSCITVINSILCYKKTECEEAGKPGLVAHMFLQACAAAPAGN